MIQDIYDPLNEYINTFRDKFKKVAEETFDALAQEAQVDVEANRITCQQIYKGEADMADIASRITRWKVLCVILWIGAVIGFAVVYVKRNEFPMEQLLLIGGGSVLAVVFLLVKVHPTLKSLRSERNDLAQKVDDLRNTAWNQMAELNKLYDWDILTRMMSKTVPRLEFDPYFTTQRLADLRATYDWNDSFNEGRSVLYSHSGLINGNPFVICRTRKMEMGQKTYYGEKTIYWTTRETDSDGKSRTVHHSETLRASVTAPYPEYYERTRLIYGNTAAPDLIFNRKPSGLAGREGSLRFKWDKFWLKRKARNLADGDFAMLTNEEFEVAFNTSNRNNNQQFALLFTPLAQQSMMALLQDNTNGYGDDFNFDKNRMINTITPLHIQELDLDMNPDQYCNFDFERAKKDFYEINARYFRAIYFSFAPLLCVPMYQQIRSHKDIYGRDMEQRSSFWEHEALANFWGQERFRHPDCVTQCVLKTSAKVQNDGSTMIDVTAHGFRSEPRLSYISKFGGDGSWHDVPVNWYEYFSVEGNGQIMMHEDNHQEDTAMTQTQRLNRIGEVLEKTHLDVYRRHIASKA